MTLMLHGIGIPGAIAIGRVKHGGAPLHAVTERSLDSNEVVREQARFRKAVRLAQKQLRALRRRVPRTTPADIRAFIESHLLMMQDTALTSNVEARIADEQCNAEWALVRQRDALLAIFDDIEDAYLRTRRDDVAHVVERILAALAHPAAVEDLDIRRDGVIEVANQLDPAQVLGLHHAGVAGIITESGGPLTHAAIVARSLGIPAVVGVRNAQTLLRDGETVVVDGHAGVVFANAEDRELVLHRRRQRQQERLRRALQAVKDDPAVTADGQEIALLANVDQPGDLRAVRASGAAGIGLYRTEFLFLERTEPPGEAEQYEAYARVVDGMRGKPVTIRTLDLGADKAIPGHEAAGENPAMGLRAIRLSLREPAWLMPQLRALLRAAAHGPLEIMLPMVTAPNEVVQFRARMEEARRELEASGTRHSADVPVGIMIEVPAAALGADQLARTADFLSVGTNDLIQYALAIDRGNDEVNYLHDPLHPAVLRMISSVLRAGRKAGIPVSLCGEMAGDPKYARLLLGLGLTRFSMHAAHVLAVKHQLSAVETDTARRYAARILRTVDRSRAYETLSELNGLC
jgi:phosphoenolpyruvate-protein phosphotransferase (PTS system enzyme I)